MSSGPPSRGGGILRSRQQRRPRGGDGGNGNDNGNGNGDVHEEGGIGRGVTFSTNGGGVVEFATWRPPSSIGDGGRRGGGPDAPPSASSFAGNGDDDDDDDNGGRGGGAGGYDSDDAEDAMLASGDAYSVAAGRKRHLDDEGEDFGGDDDDVAGVFRTPAEIAEARRRRGRARRMEGADVDGGAIAEFDARGRRRHDDDDDDGDDDGGGLSLITDASADPDSHESNASGNASCPVEPFNMDAERDGGLGYFDGDTYVFRRNGRAIDDEEDAWLDGAPGDDDDDDGGGGAGGGLDSASVWRPGPRATAAAGGERGKLKFVTDDDEPEDLGRRLANLLSRDGETAMVALARHGARARELRAGETKAARRRSRQLANKKRRGVGGEEEEEDDGPDDDDDAAAAAAAEAAMWSKAEMERTREAVEELTELADALLFGGEAEAYELTRKDWIHRFKLDAAPGGFGNVLSDSRASKNGGGGYFDDAAASIDEGGDAEPADARGPPPPPPVHRTEGVMWEYRGNEDGVIRGPYSSRQMLDWTSCGYFVGESSVDIRQVATGRDAGGGAPTPRNGSNCGKNEEDDVKADVEDLMADLLDDDNGGDDADVTKEGPCDANSETDSESLWRRSDRVDFSLYL